MNKTIRIIGFYLLIVPIVMLTMAVITRYILGWDVDKFIIISISLSLILVFSIRDIFFDKRSIK